MVCHAESVKPKSGDKCGVRNYSVILDCEELLRRMGRVIPDRLQLRVGKSAISLLSSSSEWNCSFVIPFCLEFMQPSVFCFNRIPDWILDCSYPLIELCVSLFFKLKFAFLCPLNAIGTSAAVPINYSDLRLQSAQSLRWLPL